MSQQIPLNINVKRMDHKVKRIRNYLDFYRYKSSQLEEDCINYTNEAIEQIYTESNTSTNQMVQLSIEQVNSIVELFGKQQTLVGFYQEQEDTLDQFRLHLGEREEMAANFEKYTEKMVKEEIKKSEIKEEKSQQKMEVGFSYKMQQQYDVQEGEVIQTNSLATSKKRTRFVEESQDGEDKSVTITVNPNSKIKID